MADSVNSPVYEVVILGASYAGLMAALGLAGRNTLSRIALVSESDQFVERIRLQEGVSGPVATRIPPLGVFLSKTKIEFIRGRVESLDPVRHQLEIDIDGQTRSVVFERCIYALGSHIDQDSVRGVAEHAYRLDPGDGLRSVAALRSKLEEYAGRTVRVVVVGGANTATEAAGEIKGTWPEAEVTMISRTRVGDFKKGRRLEQVTRAELKQLGVRLIDGQAISEVRATEVITASGDVIPADICIWAGGLRAASVAKRANLTTDQQDRMWVDATLSSISHPHIIGVGDAIHPIAPSGASYRMAAFTAIISDAYAAKRIVNERKGRKPRPFSYSAYGQGVAIGHSGVGFFTYPNDGFAYFILRGKFALRIRNFFVWFLVFFLKLERKYPGSSLFWIGRRRVSWKTANEAIRRASQGVANGPVAGTDKRAGPLHPHEEFA